MTSSVEADLSEKKPVLFLLRNAVEFSFGEEARGEVANKEEAKGGAAYGVHGFSTDL
jgi:hypothetical protein